MEAYLYRKWLCGRNALRHAVAYVQSNFDIGIPYCDGYEAHLQHLFGRADLTKKGAGTLVIDHPREIADRVDVEAGTLAVPDTPATARVTEASADYATDGLVLHLDATDASTLSTNELGEVVEWRSRDGLENRLLPGSEGTIVSLAPCRRQNLFNGRPMVDFGPLKSQTFMTLATRIANARTVLVVVDGRHGGGYFLGDTAAGKRDDFARGSHRGGSYAGAGDIDSPILYWGDNYEVWSNGELVAPLTRGVSGVPEILTYVRRKEADAAIGHVGLDRATKDNSGGFALGELLVWNRDLSGEELAQAYKYLQERWLDKNSPTLRELRASGDGAVSARPSIRVGTLSGGGRLVAKDGPVTVDGFADFTGSLATEGGGAWNILNTNGTVATSNPVTEGLLAHFDPSAAETVQTDDAGVVTNLTAVNDPSLTATPRNVAYGPLLRNADDYILWNQRYDSCGTRAVLDCGAKVTTNPRGLLFSQTFTNVHTVVFIIGGHYGDVQGLFGSTTYDNPFPHQFTLHAYPLLQSVSGRAGLPYVTSVDAWLNGRRVIAHLDKGYQDYQIVTFIWPHRVPLDQLGYLTKNGSAGGGQVYGEFLMWNRCLSDAERKAVEAYLSVKWFGKTLHGLAATGLPAAPALSAGSDDLTLGAEAGVTSRLGAVSGSGSLTKTGAGTLEVQGSLSELSGDVVIRGGTVKCAAPKATDRALPVTEGLIARFDANENVFTNEAGVVTNWQACAGTAPYDRYVATRFDNDNAWPALTNGPTGRVWLDFGPYGTKGTGMYFDPVTHPENVLSSTVGKKTATYGSISNCQTTVMLFNAERGGGHILGNVENFQRYGGHGATYDVPLFYPTVDNVPGIYVDGVSYTLKQASTKGFVMLKNGWQVIELYKSDKNAVAGFAHERGFYFSDRQGGQGLAEVLFYNRMLTEEERVRLRTYLYHKHRGVTAPASGTLDTMYADAPNMRSLRVDAGATLDLNGCTNTVATLACAGGSVTGGDLVVTDTLALVPGETLSVAGAVRFGETLTVTVPDDWELKSGTYRMLSATSLVNAGALRSLRLALEQGGKTRKARFDVQGNALDLVIYKMGTVLLLR